MNFSASNDTNANTLPNQFKAEILLECDLRATLGGVQNCPIVRSASDVARTFSELAVLEREVLIVGALNCQCRLLCWSLAGLGTSEMVAVRVADVFKSALRCGAVSIFLAHNHPSGSLKISVADIELTRSIAEAGSILGVQLIDHVVLAERSFKSIMTPSVLSRMQRTIPLLMINECPTLKSPRWYCDRCHTQNELYPYFAPPRKDFCTFARCAKCNGSAWLRQKA